MTTLSDRLAYPNLKKVVLLEVTAGEHLKHWTNYSGGVYRASTVAGPSCPVIDVRENGVSLTEQSSVGLVEANPGSWFSGLTGDAGIYTDTGEEGVLTDTGEVGVYTEGPQERTIYVHPSGSASPYSVTLQAIIKFHFSDAPRIYNGIFYDPRISSLPSLSMKIEHQFGRTGVLGTGAVELRNNDGYFDTLSHLQWDAGVATVKMGADNPLFYSAQDDTPAGVYTETEA